MKVTAFLQKDVFKLSQTSPVIFHISLVKSFTIVTFLEPNFGDLTASVDILLKHFLLLRE